MSQKIDALLLSYADFIIKWRYVVIMATLLIVGAIASGMPNLGFSTNYRVFFSEANPELNAFEEFQNTYTKNDNIVFILQSQDKDVTTPEMAKAIEDLTAQAWAIPYAIRVDSITNFQHSAADGDDLHVDDLIRDGETLSDSDLDARWAIAENEPLLFKNLLAEDKQATGINVTLQYPEKTITEVPEAVEKARAIADDIRAKNPSLKIALSGVSMMNNAFAEAGLKDASTLTPIMYLVLIGVMVLALRSFAGTITTILVIGFSVLVGMGFAGHAGILLTPISVTAPTVILTLAIADSVHILISMFSNMREGMNKIDALKDSIRINFVPVTITSVTTVIGFLTLNTLDTPPFHDLGNITSVGVTGAWILSLVFLPAFISLLPVKIKVRDKKTSLMESMLNKYANFLIRKRRSVLVISSVFAVVCIALLPRIEINDQWVEYFDWSIPFRADAEFGLEELSGVYLIEFSVGAKETGGVNNPEYLENLSNFTAWLQTHEDVHHVYSYSDIMKRLNKNMHGDDSDWYKIPNDRDLAAQYNLLFELSLPYGLDLNDRIDINKSATRVTVTLGNVPTKSVRAFLDMSEQWLRDNTPSYMHAKATGPTVMFSYISERNIHGMLRGNAIAILIISFLMVLALRHFGIGMLSIIPNATPILMTFGIWAILFGNIGMAAASVSAVALGIVVDDSVHFLTKYLRARREKNLNKADAIRYAFNTVGVALLVTTVILTLGFLVMSLSSFQVNEQLGLITAVTMVIALVMDFTLLPALLLIGHKDDDDS